MNPELIIYDQYKGKKVFVTGADGFIGSHLCEALLYAGALVTGLTKYNLNGDIGNLNYIQPHLKERLTTISGNVEDPHLMIRSIADHEYVFHLAALITIPYSYVSPMSYVHTNIEGTVNVLEACRINKVKRMVHTSTSEAYGTALFTPINEKHPLQGQSPYSASKIGADKMVESYYCSFDLPVSTVRPFNTFGPRQSARAVIPAIISQALTQPEIILGALAPVRDMNYVKYTVHAFMLNALTDKTLGKVMNAGSGVGNSIGDLAYRILDLMGVKKGIRRSDERIRPFKSEVFNLISDNSLAKELCGWEPVFTLDSGLLETIDFVKKNIKSFNTDKYVR